MFIKVELNAKVDSVPTPAAHPPHDPRFRDPVGLYSALLPIDSCNSTLVREQEYRGPYNCYAAWDTWYWEICEVMDRRKPNSRVPNEDYQYAKRGFHLACSWGNKSNGFHHTSPTDVHTSTEFVFILKQNVQELTPTSCFLDMKEAEAERKVSGTNGKFSQGEFDEEERTTLMGPE